MSKLGRSLALAVVLLLAGGSAQALTITSASLGQSQICADSACSPVLATLVSAGQGSGSISLGAGTLTLDLSGLSATYSDASAGTWALSGTASVTGGGGFYFVSGSVNVTLNGSPIASSGLGGTCLDPGDGTLSCGLSFTSTGAYVYQNTVNLSAPEPSAAALLGGAGAFLAGVWARRRLH